MRAWITILWTVNSDTREALRDFFEIDERYIILAALTALCRDGRFEKKDLAKAIADLGIDADKANPQTS